MRFHNAIFIALLGAQGLQARPMVSEDFEIMSSLPSPRSISMSGSVDKKTTEATSDIQSKTVESSTDASKVTARADDNQDGSAINEGISDLKSGFKQMADVLKTISPIKVDKDKVKGGIDKGIDVIGDIVSE